MLLIVFTVSDAIIYFNKTTLIIIIVVIIILVPREAVNINCVCQQL